MKASPFTLTSTRISTAALLLVISLMIVAPVAAQSSVTDDDVNDIAKDLFCPICESTPLDVCETQACADWREIIRTKLNQGQTETDIRAYFEEQYGVRALSEPPQRGFTLILWIVPLVAVVIGAFFFSRYLRDLRVAPATATAPAEAQEIGVQTPDKADSTLNDYAARIECELQEME